MLQPGSDLCPQLTGQEPSHDPLTTRSLGNVGVRSCGRETGGGGSVCPGTDQARWAQELRVRGGPASWGSGERLRWRGCG